jgi:hypothetical protein
VAVSLANPAEWNIHQFLFIYSVVVITPPSFTISPPLHSITTCFVDC